MHETAVGKSVQSRQRRTISSLMLSAMRDAGADHKRRDEMAMAAAPYLHPKLSSVDAKAAMTIAPGDEGGEIRVTFVHQKPHDEPPLF
jgi:hypothetical protein